MHFTGRTWRPPYEAHSVIIQATSGCTYNKCKFCSLYRNEYFRMSPIEEFEEDLAEIKRYQPYARRIFWTGANPFAMSYENLKLRALTVRDHLIKCQSMAMFASIRDIRSKSVQQLKKLRAMGIDGLSIGMESGDDKTLALVNKGYSSTDIVEQLSKLDQAGIEYYLVYMTGLAGKGNSGRNARNTAEVLNQINPYFVQNPYFLNIDSLTLFPNTELYRMAQRGEFIPAGEKERIEELITLLKNIRLRTRLQADTISNFRPMTGVFPKEKERMIGELQYILDTTSEEEMLNYRNSLKSL
ncbi:MAG: radical SAM protein [Lachnospiraceae bacterium]